MMPESMNQGRTSDKALLWMIRAGLALILLTPFIVTPQTIFPFVVGKALYSRALIEIVFVAWVLLALSQPAYRPPRSRLLILLGAALGIAVLSACLGVGVQRSFWSNYERMQGVVDQAHWFVLAVVLASVVRTGRDWRALLILNLAAGTVMALLTIFQYHTQLQAYGADVPRATSTLGNPIFLAAYLLVNVMIALGFLARSFIPAGPGTVARPAAARGSGRPRRGKKRSSPGGRRWQRRLAAPRETPRRSVEAAASDTAREVGRDSSPARWLGRGLWMAVALIGVWGFTLTASRGPFLGLVAGLGFLAVVYSFLGRARTARLVAIGSAGLAGIAVIFLFVSFLSPAASSLFDGSISNPLVERLTDFDSTRSSLRDRLGAWQTAARGFLEHPVLGWGPENYIAVLGQHGAELAADNWVNDHTHSKLFEELATKGLFGLLSYLAVWAFAFHVLVRSARNEGSRERAPVLFAGAALMGIFVQSQTSPEVAVGSLQSTLLLALAARLESAGEERAPAARQGDGLRSWVFALAGTMSRFTERRGIRTLLIAGTAALAGAGLSVNYATWSAASAVNRALAGAYDQTIPAGRVILDFERAISHFEPLANYPRRFFFQFVRKRWSYLRERRPGEAGRILSMVNAEAAAAVASEPENWQLFAPLVRLYALVGFTEPEYRDVAERYLDRARELAPYREEVLAMTFGLHVYVDRGRLVYVKRPCTPADMRTRAKFFLHIVPARRDDLPDNRRQDGFDNLGTSIPSLSAGGWAGSVMRDGECRITVPLPGYAITRIITGQFRTGGPGAIGEALWREEVHLR